MTNVIDTATGALEIKPSKNSSANDFDFLTGKWQIHNRKLNTRLNNCQDWSEFEATGEMHKILLGAGNMDNFLTTLEGQPFEGMSLRLFNPATRLWSIYWADSKGGMLDVPVTGSFEDSTGRFYAKDVFQGKNIIVMFQWEKIYINNPVWSQAFSEDNGKTWEWNWYMLFSREQG